MSYRQGDIIILDCDPAAGHEQKGRRPALVVSTGTFNERFNLVVVCPITNTNRPHPLHISLEGYSLKTTGFVMCEQVRAIDPAARNTQYHESAPADILDTAVEFVGAIVKVFPKH